jgi:hypothetical protein
MTEAAMYRFYNEQHINSMIKTKPNKGTLKSRKSSSI